MKIMELINKSAVVAEIERRKKELIELSNDFENQWACASLDNILSFLNTLEVKEVDLKKEFNNFLDSVEGVPRMWHSDEQIEWAKSIAKHFYELGKNARKEN